MPLLSRRERRREGVVLLVVVFFALLLMSSITTFVGRATVNTLAVRNRDAAASAEALARGGVRVAIATLLQDRIDEDEQEAPIDTAQDAWANVSVDAPDGASLSVRVEDAGVRLNLNALVDSDGDAHSQSEALLAALLEKVVDEMPGPIAEKNYDLDDLAGSLLDWIDADDVGRVRNHEDDPYLRRSPPYRAPNRPLLSVDELRMVDGFDSRMVDALRPYVTVYPYAGGGINPNTAPSYVLALLFYDDGVSLTLARESVVRQILEVRQGGGIVCPEDLSLEGCTPISEIVPNQIFPPPAYRANVFTVTATAEVGNLRRSVEAVIDRSVVDEPRMLSWKIR